MIANILLGLVATAIAGGIVVSARLVRDRVDPQGQVQNDHWKILMLATGTSIGFTVLMALFFSWVLDWIARYAARVLTSMSERAQLAEPDRVAVDLALRFLQHETWFWSWPYILFMIAIGFLAWGFETVLKTMEVGLPNRMLDHLFAGAAACVGLTLGIAVGYAAHWGFDAGSTWLFERSQRAVNDGATDFYPHDSAITLGWSRSQSAVTLGYSALLMVGGTAAIWRIFRRGRTALRESARTG